MIYPEDWREYEWRFTQVLAPVALLVEVDWRIWRITVIADAAPITVALPNAGGGPDWTIPASSTATVEPRGMLTGPVTVASAGAVNVLIEWIRRR